MSATDRLRWDAIHAGRGPADGVGLPAVFAAYAGMFPTSGSALELACGSGESAVWLALRGLEVCGLDVSPVAIGQARGLAARRGAQCRFVVADLDRGIPPGEPVDVILCHRFRAPGLYPAIAARLSPGGLLAISVLSEAGSGPGRYRAPAGELATAFAGLELVAADERGGLAWLVARRHAETHPPGDPDDS